MKNSLRFFCLVFVFLILLTMTLVSCKDDTSSVTTGADVTTKPSVSTTEGAEAEIPSPGMLAFIEDGKTEYTIIHSENTSAQVLEEIMALRSSFKKKYGKEITKKYDRIINGEAPAKDAKEIVIGLTNREESIEASNEVKSGEFLIKVVNNRIVIVGSGEITLAKAVRYFTETYIIGASEKSELPLDYVYSDDLSSEDAVCKGDDGTVILSLDKFVVSYDEENEQLFVPYAAKAFAERSKELFGSLGYCEDGEVNKYEILFGACERDEYKAADREFLFRDFYLYYRDNKLSVSAFSVYGYEAAINYLCDTKGTLTISEEGEYFEYDYGDDYFGRLLKNYENHKLEGSWMVNICHRGDITTNKYPENSLPSYKSCIDNNIDVIETDLRMTKDGVWVILHDDSLDRTTTGNGLLSEMNYSKIQEFYLLTQNGGAGSEVTEYKIPTLNEIIDLCKGKVLFNLDKLSVSDFQSVYNVFEEKDAVSMAMIKSDSCSPQELSKWFGKLLKEGRELPLFSPLLYGDPKGQTPLYKGLTSMVETGDGHGPELLSIMSEECNVRPMCLTALKPAKENVETWSSHKENGYMAIMTDEPLKLKAFIDEEK